MKYNKNVRSTYSQDVVFFVKRNFIFSLLKGLTKSSLNLI